MQIKKGDTPRIVFYMSDAADNETGETGLTPTVTISKNGGAFAAATNAGMEVAGGWYYVDLTATETNTVGSLIFKATGTGANAWQEIHNVAENILTDNEINRIIDMLFRRHLDDVETSTDGDTLDKVSLLGVALLSLNMSVAGTVATIKKTDATTLGTITITVDGSGAWTGKTI